MTDHQFNTILGRLSGIEANQAALRQELAQIKKEIAMLGPSPSSPLTTAAITGLQTAQATLDTAVGAVAAAATTPDPQDAVNAAALNAVATDLTTQATTLTGLIPAPAAPPAA